MAYSDFSLEKVKKDFQLIEKHCSLLGDSQSLKPSEWLIETLKNRIEIFSTTNAP